MSRTVTYYTDGSCVPNPGAGGFAVIKDMQVCALGHDPATTNNRMEGRALLVAILDAGSEPAVIHTDSEFWINVATKWARSWKRRGWTKNSGDGTIKNLDLVQQVYDAYQVATPRLAWVRGHDGILGNELADHWAEEARIHRLSLSPTARSDAVQRALEHKAAAGPPLP